MLAHDEVFVSPRNHENLELPQRLTLALNYADGSSTRARRIVLFIQISVVLSLAALWQETDYNWLQLRLNAANAAARFLSCEPQAAYQAPPASPPRAPTPDLKAIADLNPKLARGPGTPTHEDLENAFNCAARPLTNDERELARGYLSSPCL